MIESCARQRRRERNRSRNQVWSIWRSPIKGVGGEKTKTVTMLPELVLRNPLEHVISGDASTRPRNAFNLRLAFFFPLDFHCTLVPKFFLHSYLFVAILRLHVTIAIINLNKINFYQSSSMAKSIG